MKRQSRSGRSHPGVCAAIYANTEEVTVRELLGMTSGYYDVEGDPIIIDWLNNPTFLDARRYPHPGQAGDV